MRAVRPAVRRIAAGLLSAAVVVPVLAVTTVAVSTATATPAHAAGFTEGNVVVYRVGDGAGSLSGSAAPAYLLEYTPAGTLVQTIALPTADNGANQQLTNSGSATSEGFLARSTDGRYLTFGGYDAAVGTASVAGTTSALVNRVVGRADANGVVDTSTALTNAHTGGNIRSVVSDDGSRYWTGGSTGGVYYAANGGTVGTLVSSTITNNRVVGIADGQLYVTASTSLNRVGTGLPTTSGQTTTAVSLTQVLTAAYGYTFLDRSSDVAGVDTLYVAQDGGRGIEKYSLTGGVWTSRGNQPTNSRGLTGAVAGSTATLFATSTTNALVSVVDSAAYDAQISATVNSLVTGGTNTAFRGVAFAPVGGGGEPTAPTITDEPDSVTINSGQTATLSVVATGTAPLTYQWYVGVSGDTSTPIAGATGTSYTTPALTSTTPYWVRVTNALGSDDSATATVTIASTTPCVDPVTAISAVQGSGETSPLAGQTVTVRGTVVSDDEGASPALRGFYLQDAGDGDATTSDGLFVFNGGANQVSNGDVVAVSGVATEFQGQTQIAAQTAPTAVPLTVTSCGTTGTVTPTDVTLPFATSTTVETYEGMLVRFPQELSVTELFQLGRFGQVTVSANGRLYQPTNVIEASDQPAVQALQDLNNRSQVIVDDALQNQNADPIVFGRGGQPLTAANTLRGGDTLTGAVGVMTFTWAGNSASPNAYRLRPVNALTGSATFVAANPRPTTAPEVGDGALRVASVNLLNFFNTFTGCTFGLGGATADCRGADDTTEYNRQLVKEIEAIQLLDADVIGYMEMENDGYGPASAVQALVDALNAEDGAGAWALVDPDAATGVLNSAGDDAIKSGFIYRTATVTAVAGSTWTNLDGVFDRAPVAQTFADGNGSQVTVIANHFKSKGSCPSGSGPDADQGDGQSCWNNRRTLQAGELVSWIDDTIVPGSGDEDVMVLGDLNSYAGEDPIGVLEDAGYTNLVRAFQGEEAYSYVFDGQWGYLDYQLASPSLLPQVTGANDLHINADEPSVLDYNTDFKTPAQQSSLYAPDAYRTSDHDPVLAALDLGTAAVISGTPPAGTVGAPYSFAFTTSGDATVTVAGGALPPGLTLSADGVLSGTPTDGGSYPVTVQATNAFGSSQLSVTVVIDPAASTTTLTADPNPVATGATVTLTATVDGPVPAGGTVTFTDGGAQIGTATVQSDGTATLGTTDLTAGTHSIVATYGGSTALAGSASDAVTVEVIDPVALGATVPNGAVGVAYSESVPATGGGTIQFAVTDGTLPPGLSLSADGVLSGTPTAGGSFTFEVTATNAVSSATQGYTVTVTKAATSISVTSSANPSPLRADVQFTAQVTNTLGPAPEGTVQFLVNGQPAGTPVAVGPDGSATSQPLRLPVGGRQVTATYSGDAALAASQSAPIQQVTQYVVAMLSPTPGQTVVGGSMLTIRFRLTDVRGVPISDSTAQGLLSGSCRVRVSVSGVQNLASTCPTYDAASNTFTVQTRTSSQQPGDATARVTIAYPGVLAKQTVSTPFTIS